MDGVPTGPCLPHCYKCPKVIAYASNVAIVFSIAFIVLVLGIAKLDEQFKSTIWTNEMMENYKWMQRRRWFYTVMGIICGALAVYYYKPYTIYKLL